MNAISFGLFAFAIGFVSGASSSEIVATLLTFLFYFIGAKFYKSIIEDKESGSSCALALFSIFLIFGLSSGIYIKENRLFTDLERQNNIYELSKKYDVDRDDYLRGFETLDD